MKHITMICSNEDTEYFEKEECDTEEEPTELFLKFIKNKCGEVQHNDVFNIYIEELEGK